MTRQRTPITISDPAAVEGLLGYLTDIQRERFSERRESLDAQGVEPGDSWQVAATRGRQADFPTYEPTADEQESIERATAQLEGRSTDTGRRRSLDMETTATDASISDANGGSGGIVQDESIAQEGLRQIEEEPQQSAIPPERLQTSRKRSESLNDADSDSDASTTDADTTSDDNERAEDILENARQFLDRAIAVGVANEGAEIIVQSSGQSYAVSRDLQGVLTVENRETGGIAIGDEEGVRQSGGLTETDQQTWLNYSQVSEEQLQQQQQQRQQRQRQRRSADLEL